MLQTVILKFVVIQLNFTDKSLYGSNYDHLQSGLAFSYVDDSGTTQIIEYAIESELADVADGVPGSSAAWIQGARREAAAAQRDLVATAIVETMPK